MNINKVISDHTDFPEYLRNIPSPPKELYVLGDLSSLKEHPVLSIVGSRKVTAYGKSTTRQLALESARAGAIIISGLALGVDSISHEAALEAKGTTIAVLPCGLDQIYPRQHHQLAQKIIGRGGALISEYPEGTPPLRQHFIARNRLVSGLADAVLITEAAERSGTLHTANFALEQGKTVMAVPGNINSPYSIGTNNLIKSGALAVTKTDDILNELGLNTSNKKNMQLFGNTEEEAILLNLLSSGISDSSILLINSNLEAAVFNQTLTMLEINGLIRPLGAGHWTLT